MRVLLLSYGVIQYDGRLLELIKLSNRLGETVVVCCSDGDCERPNYHFVNSFGRRYLSLRLYLSFLSKSFRVALFERRFDVLIVDNYFAAVAGLFVRLFPSIKYTIYDARELYFPEQMPTRKGRALIRIESVMIRRADTVLCANRYRAQIMFEYFALRSMPLVFENVRMLDGKGNDGPLVEKYSAVLGGGSYVISTGGFSIARGVDRLVRAAKFLPVGWSLVIVGGGSENDIERVREIIKCEQLHNVVCIGRVPYAELKSIVRKCQIGIVHYHQDDLNNQYCASGKIWEYLGEGLPIVVTENIPLKDFCDEHGVGESDNFFYRGILKVISDIDGYREKVARLMSVTSSEEYVGDIARVLDDRIRQVV